MTPDDIKASYRRLLDERGETVQVRRYTGTGSERPRFDADVMAVVTGYAPHELVGSIKQGDRKAIVLAEDLIAKQFPLPVRVGDKLVLRGKELNVEGPDDDTRRVGGQIIAYELQCRG